jgi:hypothetical protein
MMTEYESTRKRAKRANNIKVYIFLKSSPSCLVSKNLNLTAKKIVIEICIISEMKYIIRRFFSCYRFL